MDSDRTGMVRMKEEHYSGVGTGGAGELTIIRWKHPMTQGEAIEFHYADSKSSASFHLRIADLRRLIR